MVAVNWLDVDAVRLDEVCRRYGIARLFLFGSVARGEEGPDSDIDLLYELRPGARLGWEVDDLADELAGLFGRAVDLVSRRSINPRLRSTILRDIRSLYAA